MASEADRLPPRRTADYGRSSTSSMGAERELHARHFENLLHRAEIYSTYASKHAFRSTKPNTSKAEIGSGDHRHRKTEAEEDEALLADFLKPEEEIFRFDSSPEFIKNGELTDYQVSGLNWMISLFEHGVNGILADEQGLNKSIQAISLLGYLKNFRDQAGPHLVVTSRTLQQNWINEIHKWCPSLRCICLTGGTKDRKVFIQDVFIPGYWDVCVTSYEMCICERTVLKRVQWRCMLVDDTQRFRGEKAKLAEVLKDYRSHNRFMITDFQLDSNVNELWALLHFLLPEYFNSSKVFEEWFNHNSMLGVENLIKRLHSVLRPFIMRRSKLEMEGYRPQNKEVKLFVGLTKLQRQFYTKILLKDIDIFNTLTSVGIDRVHKILLQLWKCTNHPYLFEEETCGKPYKCDINVVRNSGKMMVLDKLLTKVQSEGSRVLLFTQMTRMLDILEDYCRLRRYQFCRVDDYSSYETRLREVKAFNSETSNKFIFMLTSRTAGMGLYLASADVVILYDSDRNPHVDLRALERVRFKVQRKDMRIFRFITEHTVEEKMVERAEVNLRLSKLMMQQGRLENSHSNELNIEDLLRIIRYGAKYVFATEERDFDANIEAILQRGEAKTLAAKAHLDELSENALRSYKLVNDTIEEPVAQVENKIDNCISCHRAQGGQAAEPAESSQPQGQAAYTVNDYFREVKRSEDAKPLRLPCPPNQPVIHDFQFFPDRLQVLLDKEACWYRRTQNYRVPIPDRAEPSLLRELHLQQLKIDQAEPLSSMEKAEMKALLKQGFEHWTRRDFNQFIKANEKYGRDDFKAISLSVESKTPDQVLEYSSAFWENAYKLTDIERIIAQIERGEHRIQRAREIKAALSRKLARCNSPLRDLRIQYGTTVRTFTEEEDRYLVYMMHKWGLEKDNFYERLRTAIRASPSFQFDWFFKSRTVIDLQRRCATLISLIEQENNLMDERERRDKERRAKEKLERKRRRKERAERVRAEKLSDDQTSSDGNIQAKRARKRPANKRTEAKASDTKRSTTKRIDVKQAEKTADGKRSSTVKQPVLKKASSEVKPTLVKRTEVARPAAKRSAEIKKNPSELKKPKPGQNNRTQSKAVNLKRNRSSSITATPAVPRKQSATFPLHTKNTEIYNKFPLPESILPTGDDLRRSASNKYVDSPLGKEKKGQRAAKTNAEFDPRPFFARQ